MSRCAEEGLDIWAFPVAHQVAQSLRTDLRNARANVNGMKLAVAFNGWRCIATGDRDANEWMRAAYTSWYTVCRHAALALRQLESAQSQKRHSLKTDRRTQWESIAGDAQRAADRGDTRELYRLARRLGAFKPGVKLKDGTLASDDAGLARWAEHFAALLGGKQVESVKAPSLERHEDEQMLQLCNTLDLSPEAVFTVLQCMPKQRAVGPDGIASEIWIAGGDKLADVLSVLMRRIVANGTVPPQWKGGRLARLYKGKGDAADCNSHRGLLVADHASKVFTSLLHMRPTLAYGAVRMRARACDAHEQTLRKEGCCA